MNKQNIYENVRYYIGKITVILMMVLFPFVMTDKLNNVTKTRYVFFVIIALVGWIAMLINEVVSGGKEVFRYKEKLQYKDNLQYKE